VKMPLVGCLNHDGISRVSLKQEPPILQGGEDIRNIGLVGLELFLDKSMRGKFHIVYG